MRPCRATQLNANIQPDTSTCTLVTTDNIQPATSRCTPVTTDQLMPFYCVLFFCLTGCFPTIIPKNRFTGTVGGDFTSGTVLTISQTTTSEHHKGLHNTDTCDSLKSGYNLYADIQCKLPQNFNKTQLLQ